MNIHEVMAHKAEQHKLTMMTCYDFSMARIINQSDVDMLLVGDSAAMVMHGHNSTLPISVEVMALHVAAVARGAPDKFIVGDLPFLSYRKSLSENMYAVEQLMQAGAHAVKLEGIVGNEALIQHIVDSGVPVMGHLGLTPQSVNALGGFKVQARNQAEQDKLKKDSLLAQQCGCFSLVLECVPQQIAADITALLEIPTIGIGAGVHVDGQVLVLQDMLGMSGAFKPKFLRQYLDGEQLILQAMNAYAADVKSQQFPSTEESYQ
ncbi:3-methyl-2-oxobutanoate hydroxymethyltransferase [Marinicella sp. W31]|uniref:3-methyl-2-oxobutanoate hydroxymethyltransferase n=1 Tax=Marinicella sp. W31 TaxID=3023713 RepID=UPI003757EC6E